MTKLVSITLSLSFLAFVPNVLANDSPRDGVVSANSYVNSFFHLTCKFPDGWTVQSASKGKGDTFDLFVAQPNIPEKSLSLSAQTMSANPGFSKEVSKYLDLLAEPLQAKGWQRTGERVSQVYGGLRFTQQEFIVESGSGKYYVDIAATPLHGYMLRLSFSAASPEALEALTKTAQEIITIMPDFGPAPDPPAASSGPPPQQIHVAPSISKGQLIYRVNPEYPMVAKHHRISGTVFLDAMIGADGSIKRMYVLEGDPALTTAALDAVKQWRYKPYLLNGQPVEVDSNISVSFFLSGP